MRRWTTLRAKLTLALLVTGLASAVLVGFIARALVLQRFDQILLANSFDYFQNDVIDYVATYGSWDAAARAEPFGQFERRRNGPPDAPPPPGADGRPLPPPRGAAPRRPRPGAPPPGGPSGGRLGGPPPPRGGFGQENEPPFRFLLLDPSGERVLLGPEAFKADQRFGALRAAARPIVVNGAVAVLAIPLRQPNLTDYDRSYLEAMQSAVAYGIAGAAMLALALGFFFSGRLSRNLSALTAGLMAVRQGHLGERVRVKSRDEIGVLAGAFNRMSEELAASHARIREQAEMLKELSIRDELTQLHNRRYFDERAVLAFAHARRYQRPLSVMICDIDHFKRINDTFSHATGDEVLRRVAAILQADTRATDIVARYGGEEFVVMFTESAVDQAVVISERIRERIQGHAWEEIHPDLRVTLSLGLDNDLTRGSAGAMLAAADERLYEAKQRGRNQVVANVA